MTYLVGKYDVMVDIETLGNKPDSIILAIGAVSFDRTNKKINLDNTFNQRIHIDSCINFDLKIQESTLLWWLTDGRHDTLKKILLEPSTSLTSALLGLNNFVCGELGPTNEIWCNHPSFDFGILKNAYQKIRIEPIWGYWQETDMATWLKGRSFEKPKIDTMHLPIDDCIDQINFIFQAN